MKSIFKHWKPASALEVKVLWFARAGRVRVVQLHQSVVGLLDLLAVCRLAHVQDAEGIRQARRHRSRESHRLRARAIRVRCSSVYRGLHRWSFNDEELCETCALSEARNAP